MNDQLIHILDQSACLSRRQVRDYLAGAMEQEEQHAVELHLITCPLCGLAMEGLETSPAEGLAGMAEMNSGFLKAHFDTLIPQIHLNSMAPAHALQSAARRRQGHSQPALKHVVLIGALVAVFALLWYFEFGRKKVSQSAPAAAPVQEMKPPTLVPPAMANTPAPAKAHPANVHPADEALIREAKALNAHESVELTDEELTQVFNESNSRGTDQKPAPEIQPRSGTLAHPGNSSVNTEPGKTDNITSSDSPARAVSNAESVDSGATK